MSFSIHMRQRCLTEALQSWLDQKSPGHVIVDIKIEPPHRVELVIEDKDATVKPDNS